MMMVDGDLHGRSFFNSHCLQDAVASRPQLVLVAAHAEADEVAVVPGYGLIPGAFWRGLGRGRGLRVGRFDGGGGYLRPSGEPDMTGAGVVAAGGGGDDEAGWFAEDGGQVGGHVGDEFGVRLAVCGGDGEYAAWPGVGVGGAVAEGAAVHVGLSAGMMDQG